MKLLRDGSLQSESSQTLDLAAHLLQPREVSIHVRRGDVAHPARLHPGLALVDAVPGPIAGALRTGLDILITLTPKVHFA